MAKMMCVPRLKDICGGGEDHLHIQKFTCTPRTGISHVCALLWWTGTESSFCILSSFLICFSDRGCEFWRCSFSCTSGPRSVPVCITPVSVISFKLRFALQKCHFWLPPFWIMPTCSGTQLGCKSKAWCISVLIFMDD